MQKAKFMNEHRSLQYHDELAAAAPVRHGYRNWPRIAEVQPYYGVTKPAPPLYNTEGSYVAPALHKALGVL